MIPFSISYRFEGRDVGLTLWARDAQEAERRLKALWDTGDVLGPQLVEVPVTDSRPLLMALGARIQGALRQWRLL